MDAVAQIPPTDLLRYIAIPPVATNSAGVKGQFSYDGSYFYICVATSTWLRAEILSW